MTREEAKSELMQIYMSLSEEKKKALDVLMAQADVTDDDIETMRILFNADIECLCNQGRFNDAKEMEQIRDRLKARLQADGEYKSNKELLCDSCYRKSAGCQAKFHNPHPVDHCIEYKPIEKQADGEYISREAVIDIIEDVCPIYENDYRYILREKVNELPSVDIPSAEPCEDANDANQHNSNTLNDVGQHTNALEGDAISRQDDRGVSLKSVKHALYDVCLHEDNMALFSKLLDRVNKARDWEEYQAIKQEPCTHPDKCHECEKILTCTYYKQEPCEDAISREAVIKTVDAHTNEDGTLDDDISVILEELPSFKPQEKTGHWVYDYTSADGHKTYHCSECGCYLQPKHSEPLNSFKWCSSCGVKMIEPQERSEE